MSQFPPSQPPYQGPQHFAQFTYATPPDPVSPLLAPARRAGLLMIIRGALALVCGLCAGFVTANYDKVPPETRTSFESQMPPNAPPAQNLLLGFTIGCMAAAIVLLVLGFLVRGNRKIPIIISLIVTLGLSAMAALSVLTDIAVGLSHGQANLVIGSLPSLAVLVMLVVIVFSLFQAMGSWAKLAQIKAAYELQMAQYQQQQQIYQQTGGYGYGYGGGAPPTGPQTQTPYSQQPHGQWQPPPPQQPAPWPQQPQSPPQHPAPGPQQPQSPPQEPPQPPPSDNPPPTA